MREIKFRAWDKETNTMIYSDKHNKKDYQVEYDFTFNEKGQVVCWWNEDYDDSFGYSKSNSGYLDNIMQYTGLKDKNGKEIYEGDIINYTDGEFTRRKGIIEFDCWGFMLKEILTNNREFSQIGFLGEIEDFEEFSIEIIGNIYENPELLKE